MRTEHLEYLLDLKETSSLSKTAEKYFTSHQVINNAIKSLEKELDIIILDRTSKGITFTDAGMLVLAYAKKAVTEKNTLLDQLSPYCQSDKAVLKGTLNVYTISRFSNKYFLRLYASYCHQNPHTAINLKTVSATTFFSLLPIDELFTFITTAHSGTLSSELFRERLQKYNLVYEVIVQSYLGLCIAQKSPYLPLAKEFQSSGQKSSLPFVVHNYSLAEHEVLFSDIFTNFFIADNFESQKQLIKSGEYIGMCTPQEFRQIFYTKDNSLLFIPNASLQRSSFYYIAIYQQGMQTNPILHDFLETLKKAYK